MKKVVGASTYVHKSNITELLSDIPTKDRANVLELATFYYNCYEVIKYNRNGNKLSLIESPDWDTAKEPIVGDSYVIDLNTSDDINLMKKRYVKGSKTNPQIYHSKEYFVSPNYKGFDIEAAKRRTAEWNAIPNLNKKLIGRKNYWVELLKENNMEV